VRVDSKDETAAKALPGLLDKAPALLILSRQLELIDRVDLAAEKPGVFEAIAAARKVVGSESVSVTDYRRAAGEWREVQTLVAAGKHVEAWPTAKHLAERVAGLDTQLPFTAKAKKLAADLEAEVMGNLRELKKAHAAKDWKRFFTIVFELRPAQFELEKELRPLLEGLETNNDAKRASQEVAAECMAPLTRELLAKAALHKAEALEALRAKVPASEVADEDVTVVFWERARRGSSVFYVGGYWLGKDRACVATWDVVAKKLVSAGKGASGKSGEEAPSFFDLQAADEATREAFELLRKFVRWEAHAVVPTRVTAKDGKLEVLYFDGWDGGCDHFSFGWAEVDPKTKVVELKDHVM
jgi:hypothetical protein